jgi:iron(III) transport system ATP-binding protein
VRTEGGPASLPVRVRKATYLGSHLEYVLDSSVGELFAVDPDPHEAVAGGATAFAHFREEGVALVPRTGATAA